MKPRSLSQIDAPESIRDFFSDVKGARRSAMSIESAFRRKHKKHPTDELSFAWVLGKSGLPWLQLDIKFPAKKMLQEAMRVRDRFVGHRSGGKNTYDDGNRGWCALALHGISSTHTMDYRQYGYKTEDETPYRWTEIADLCPTTTKFFKEKFPFAKYYRVRYTIIEPGGFIYPHTDRKESYLWEVNLALNNPVGFHFKMKDKGYVPYRPGEAYILDVSNVHAVVNLSNEDRYHMIVQGTGLRSPKWHSLIERSFKKFLSPSR